MKIFFLILICALYAKPKGEWKSISKNNMELKYRFDGDWIEFQMAFPLKGWVAVGFNPEPGLTGSHLVMAAVIDGEAVLSERHVVRPGEYPAIESLGGKGIADMVWGKESPTGTSIGFRLPRDFADRYRHALAPGKSMHLILAYSREDDFLHHSAMRTSIHITL